MMAARVSESSRSDAAGRRAQAPDGSRKIRVCWAGTFDRAFHRSRVLGALLRRTGLEVDVRHVALWGPRRDEDFRRGKLRILLRACGAYPVLAWRLLTAPRPDVVLVGYPGHFDMLLIAGVARLWRAPVVLDVFLSIFDTVVSDRNLVSPRSFLGRIAAAADRIACRSADRLLADTPAHAAFLARHAGVPADRFRTLWIGAREDLFRPLGGVEPEPGRVLFYGTFIRLHGIDAIVRAAKRLEPDAIRFRIIGRGQEWERIQRLSGELEVRNVDFLPPVPIERLPREIARATLCLGIFGTSGKAARVLPNKLFESLAVGRPVLTADTPAVRSAFAPGEVATSPPGDAGALAAAIRELMADGERRESIARAGHRRYLEDYGEEPLSRLLEDHLEEAVARGRGGAPRPLGNGAG